ncbi:hypothetical protein BH11BAC1_BH11BAC1_27260 [soil metagenome]
MKTGIISLVLIFVWLSSPAQDFKKHILFLASDSLHGRAPATIDERNAADYIHHEFVSGKCTSVSFQKFPFGTDAATNVIGMLDLKKDSTVIISAHYDHLGYGSDKSHEINKRGIHHGADDNASGVAMMIELAKWIIEKKDWNYNFVFAAYSAHEAGLYGSDNFSKSEMCSALKIRAVVNLDMVGRLDKTSSIIRVSGKDTDPGFSTFFQSDSGTMLHFRFDDTNINQSDLKSFAALEIPVLNFTTGVHDDYHKMSDTEDKINYDGMKKVYSLIETLLINFCTHKI